MSDLNNLNKSKELSTVDLIINFWKFKKVFFYILIPILLTSFIVEKFIPKKNIVQVQLTDPLRINLNFYPIDTLYNLELDLTSIHLEKIVTHSRTEKLDYFGFYLKGELQSPENLINFSKMTNEEYNLYSYIKNKKLSVEQATINRTRDVLVYNLRLPITDKNIKFFYEYIVYVNNLCFELLKKDLIIFHKKNLELLEKEEMYIDNLILSTNQNNENTVMSNLDENTTFKKNILIIENFHREKRKNINKDINLIKNFEKEFSKEAIIMEGPMIKKVGGKFSIILQFLIPVILSLIIYLFYILVKLTKNDHKN